MAKNHNNDKDGGILRENIINEEKSLIDKLEDLKKRPKYLVWSFVLIAIIMLISFIIPEKYYHSQLNILFLNIELLILFIRDILLYFIRSCKMIRITMGLMVFIYVLNIIDLLFGIPHTEYITLCISVISIALGLIYFIGRK